MDGGGEGPGAAAGRGPARVSAAAPPAAGGDGRAGHPAASGAAPAAGGGTAEGGGTLCLVSVTVAGQCRERSPVDKAVFGGRGERFEDRFADPDAGRLLLAQAVAEGAAAAEIAVRPGAAAMPAEVALWRQRGGDRIRVLAAFALRPGGAGGGEAAASPSPAGRPASGAGVPRPPGAARAEGGEQTAMADYARQIERTLEATRSLLEAADRDAAAGADGMSGEGARPGAGMAVLAPSLWRLSSLAALMQHHGADGTRPAGAAAALAETDPALATRRVMALHRARAAGRGIGLSPPPAESLGRHGVMVDQPAFWGALEAAIDLAGAGLGAGGSIEAAIEAGGDMGIGAEHGTGQQAAPGVAVVLRLTAGEDGRAPVAEELHEVAALAEAAGAPMTLSPPPPAAAPVPDEGGAVMAGAVPEMRLVFAIAPSRCLPPA